MKRDYSFNQISQITLGQLDFENKPISQPYYTANKQNKDNWTDQRVQEIKKKYDTPSHRKIISNYGAIQRNNQSSQLQNNTNSYNSYRNALRDSIASPNVTKMDVKNYPTSYQEDPQSKNAWQESQYVPRFSYDSKENTTNFMEKFSNIKNSMKLDQKSVNRDLNKYKQFPSSKIDPRVQNIDKINMKIKKILDCLHQNQTYNKQVIGKIDRSQQLKGSLLKGSIMSKGRQSDELEQTKIISRQKIIGQKESINPPIRLSIMQNERYSLSPQVRNETSSKWRLEEKYNNIRNSKTFENQEKSINKQAEQQTDSWFEPNKNRDSRNRARSCLGNFKNEEIHLNSGKKLDEEITKINTRIKQFEEEKKKLNIQFKPYNYEMKYNRSTSNLGQHRFQRGNNPPLPKPTRRLNQYTPSYAKKYSEKTKTQEDEIQPRYTVDAKRSVNFDNYNRNLSRINSSSFRIDAIESLKFEQKRQKAGTPQFQERTSETDLDSKPQFGNPQPCSQQLKLKTEQGIQQRKRKLLQTATVTFSRETKRLISNLFQQVKLDQELRNAKIWYRDLLAPNKLELLRKQAQKSGIRIDQSQLEVTEQEDNPFYSVRQSDQSYACLVDRWIRADKYWKQNILGKFNLKQFAVEKFTNQKLDLQRKGYFVVEDLVRFLNMQTGTFYRNRDLILVFRRLSQGNKLHWQQFLSKLDQQN